MTNLDNKAIIFYLTDVFAMLNQLNKNLQGKQKTLIDCKTSVCGFINKLQYLSAQLSTKRFSRFPYLERCQPSDKVIEIALNHLQSLKTEFNIRFSDLNLLSCPTWLLQPLLFDISGTKWRVRSYQTCK